MADRLIALAYLFHQARKRHVRIERRQQGHARFQIALRLAPQRVPHAQLAQGSQQHRIARMQFGTLFYHLSTLLPHVGDLQYRPAELARRDLYGRDYPEGVCGHN